MSQDALPSIGKYQLLRKLATGGMAEVYLARAAGPMGFEKLVVLKRVLPHLAEEENFVTMFLSEARLVAQLNHPNVVQVFDFGEHLGVWFLVMELIDGPNLRALLKRAAEAKEPLPMPLVARVISLACEGLAYAHDFIDPNTRQHLELVHRDISPDNILLSRTGAVKVVDFGIAKVANQLHHTRTGMVRGKFSYMPPEQLQGDKLDRRADVYALGMCLYELLTGTRPFDTSVEAVVVRAVLYESFKKATDFRPDIPPALLAILDKALAKKRDERYRDCRAMQADLERYIAAQGQPVSQYDVAQLVLRLAGPSPWASPGQPTETPAELMTPSTADRLVQIPPTPATVQVPEVAAPGPVGPYDTTEIDQRGVPVPAHSPPPPPPEPPPPPKDVKRPRPPPKGPTAQVEFRVRPFGTVYLDGKLLGDTPMDPVMVPVGRHALRIVNKELGREERRTIDVPAKGLTVRHSFGE